VNKDTILVINGEIVRKEEYDFLSSCSSKYLDSYSDDKYDLKTRKVLLIRAEQILLKESGIIKDYSYYSFIKQLEQENQKRKDLLDQNQILYGPKQYDKKVYFDYYYSECRAQYAKQIQVNADNSEKNYEELDRLYEELLFKKVKELKVKKGMFSFGMIEL
jgi:hypothetical protein